MMAAGDVLGILSILKNAGIPVWLDGGWGVDALVGRQSRPHDDLDVVLSIDRVGRLQEILGAYEYQVAEDEMPTRFVLADQHNHRIDVHPVTFDGLGNGIQTLQDGSPAMYPASGFTDAGTIEGNPVGCLTSELQVRHHTGYAPDAKDFHDVRLLHERFGVDLPDIYRDQMP